MYSPSQSSNSSILAELYKYNPSSIVELYELDLSSLKEYYTSKGAPIATTIYRFYNGYNEKLGNVVWDGNTYAALPIQLEGVQVSSAGEVARPTLTVANHDLNFTQFNKAYANLVGAKLRRIRTLVKFLDSTNFQTRNLFINSQALDTWTQTVDADVNVLSNVAVAPDGTTTADKIYEATQTSSSHGIVKAVAGLANNVSVCFSVYLKAGERQYATLLGSSKTDTNLSGKTFDLVNGTVSSVTRTLGPTVLGSGIAPVGNGWYRCWVTFSTMTGALNPQYSIYLDNDFNPTSATYAGVSPTNANTFTTGIYAWGAQAEVITNPTLTPTTYQATGSALGNPTADPNAKFPDDLYVIDRMSEETPGQITYELAPAWDVEGIQLPRRQIIANICPWTYKKDPCTWGVNGVATVNTISGLATSPAATYTGVATTTNGTGTGAKLTVTKNATNSYTTVTVHTPGTGYAAGNTLTVKGSLLGGTDTTNNLSVNVASTTSQYFDANDLIVSTAAEDQCGKRLTSCKIRFGTRALPFGGFPSAGLYGKPI